MHLEDSMSLGANYFLMALHCFVAAHGLPNPYSLTITACLHLQTIFCHELQPQHKIQDYVRSYEVTRHFHTPRSLWMGGHFERMVRTIKSCLATSLQRKLLNSEEFQPS